MRERGGNIVELDLPRHGGISELGAPRFGWRRLNLSGADSTTDPGTRLSSAITDSGLGAGIVFPLTGSWGSTDWSGAYPYVTWKLRDLFGRHLGGNTSLSLPFFVRLWTTLAATDEFVIGVSLATENVLTGTTVEAKGVYVVGTGAGSNLATGNSSCNNGTGTESNGASTAGVVSAAGSIIVHGGTTPRLYSNGSLGVDSSGNAAGGGVAALGAVTLSGVPANWYLHAFAGRLSAGVAGAISPAADFFVGPIVHHGFAP